LEHEQDLNDESRRIVVAAAELIRAQIRIMQYDCSHYPDTTMFSNVESAKAWVPSLLLTFVETIIPNALKQTAVCHSIVQAARLQSPLSPFLFGIGMSLDHLFGSKTMLDMLS